MSEAELSFEAEHRQFRPYPKYRDSGVEWLGDIPAHWGIVRVKEQFNVINGSTPSSSEPAFWDGDIVWVTPDDLGELDSPELSKSRRNITNEGYRSCGTSLVPKDSLVLSTRAPIGHLAIASVMLCTNQGCKSLVFKSDRNCGYFYYLLRSARPELESLGQGSTFNELAKSKLSSLIIVKPPKAEENAVAAFLDRETAKIDALIEKKERLIELLQEKRTALITQAVTKGLDPSVPMKDSGVEWLGQIPAHWDLAPVYAQYDVSLGKMLDTKRITGEHLGYYLRNIDVQWDRININDLPQMDFSRSELDRYLLMPGDLLVCEGGEAGRSAIWQGELENCFYQKAIHRARPLKKSQLPRFLFFLLNAAAKIGVFEADGNPNTINHLTAVQLKHHRVTFPPYFEQHAIAAFLDHETAKIDALIGKIQEAIDRLKEYRTALISAAVTGKIDARELVRFDNNISPLD